MVGNNIKIELFCLISLLACSFALTNNIDELHNQLNDNQQPQKRASGFVPMRGRKNDEEFSNSNMERPNNEKEASLADNNSNLDLVKTLNNLLKLNNNGNLEEQLNILDQAYGQPTNQQQGQLSLHRNGYEPYRKYHMFNQRSYNGQQVTPFLGLMTRYGSPKRAGFVPMRGRKSDPNVLLMNDEDEYNPFSYKRAGFLPMRGKKSSMELDDLENQFNQYSQKRAFHALRG